MFSLLLLLLAQPGTEAVKQTIPTLGWFEFVRGSRFKMIKCRIPEIEYAVFNFKASTLISYKGFKYRTSDHGHAFMEKQQAADRNGYQKMSKLSVKNIDDVRLTLVANEIQIYYNGKPCRVIPATHYDIKTAKLITEEIVVTLLGKKRPTLTKSNKIVLYFDARMDACKVDARLEQDVTIEYRGFFKKKFIRLPSGSVEKADIHTSVLSHSTTNWIVTTENEKSCPEMINVGPPLPCQSIDRINIKRSSLNRLLRKSTTQIGTRLSLKKPKEAMDEVDSATLDFECTDITDSMVCYAQQISKLDSVKAGKKSATLTKSGGGMDAVDCKGKAPPGHTAPENPEESEELKNAQENTTGQHGNDEIRPYGI